MLGQLATATATALLCSLAVGFSGVTGADDEPLYFPTIVSHARVLSWGDDDVFRVFLCCIHGMCVCVHMARVVSCCSVFSGRVDDDIYIYIHLSAYVCVSALFARGVDVSPALSTDVLADNIKKRWLLYLKRAF